MTSWSNWTTGRRDWKLGALQPDEVLYFYDGPAIFLQNLGLNTYLFYKSDDGPSGDYYVAAEVSEREIAALKRGALSVRGALAHRTCWLLDVDFSMHVQRYEEANEALAGAFLPPQGVPLLGSHKTAADSVEQTDAMFAFKFFGNELSEEGMPFSTFRGLVDRVYDVVRDVLTPASLSAGRDRQFLDFPVRQPQFASLLIAIDPPSVDAARMQARERTKKLIASEVEKEAEARGVDFAEKIEQTVDVARAGKLSHQYAEDNFAFLEKIMDILPSTDSDISGLQFSSASGGNDVFVEVDAQTGDKIKSSFKAAEDRSITISGRVSGVLEKSKTFRLETAYGREITCQLGHTLFDALVSQDRLKIGAGVNVTGRFRKRDFRDHMKVDHINLY